MCQEKKNQISKIRNEKGEVTTDNAELQRIMRLIKINKFFKKGDYYKQQYGNQTDNLEEMDRFFKKFNLPRLD